MKAIALLTMFFLPGTFVAVRPPLPHPLSPQLPISSLTHPLLGLLLHAPLRLDSPHPVHSPQIPLLDLLGRHRARYSYRPRALEDVV